MGVGIDEPWKDNFAGAIDFANVFSVLPDPGIAQSVFGFSDGNNLAPDAQHRCVFDDAEFAQLWTAPRAGIGGGRAQREELADVK